MRLKISDLQRVAGETMNAESEAKALREEIVRVLGQRVVVEAPIGRVAADACQVIDADEMSGLHNPASKFDKGLMLRYTRHGNPHVRKLAARVVSVKHLTRMLDDTNSLVRAEAAKRAGMELVSEALNRHPEDDGLYDTYVSRLLCEDGIKQPKVTDDEPFDMYGEEPLGDAAKQQSGPELSDTWYKNRAFEFMQDYGTNIEYAWEETLVKVYCDALHTTSGIDVDRTRLLKAIKDMIEEKEDRALERDGLKEAVTRRPKNPLRVLRPRRNGGGGAPALNEAHLEEADVAHYFDVNGDIPQCPRCGKMLSGSPGCLKCAEPGHCDYDQEKMVSHDLEETVDPVSSLAPHLGTQEFIEAAKQVFSIGESTVPSGVRKHRLGEGNAKPTNVPIVGKLPEGRTSFTFQDERALDEFCRRWSKVQASMGEPYMLRWDPHPDQAGKVGFRLELL